MRHIMHDLETLGTRAGCSILSIGAVEFNPETGEHGREFYTVVSRYSCEMRGLFEDPDTVAWWNDQSDEAKAVLELAGDPFGPDKGTSQTLPQACGAFQTFLLGIAPADELRLYGNGADFDNPIIQAGFAAADVYWPIKFGGRCYRTLKSLEELLGERYRAPEKVRVGTYHNALDDAKTQALHMCAHLSSIRQLQLALEVHQLVNETSDVNDLEWSSTRSGPGDGPHGSGGGGALYAACPTCGGLKEGNGAFRADAVGHDHDCRLAILLDRPRREEQA